MKIKLLTPTANAPTKGSLYAAGFDLYADEDILVPARKRKIISTGIAIKLPTNCFGRIAPRSGLALKHGIDVLAGVIDEDYRGEVMVILYNSDGAHFEVKRGDRIAQLLIQSYRKPTIEIVEELDDTARGAGGFGSSGTGVIGVNDEKTK
jgi:dUTP pyrophosphatase